MNGLWILVLLIFISALPVFLVFLWFHLRRFPRMPRLWFLLSLLAGLLSLGIALLIQGLVPSPEHLRVFSPGAALFNCFVRIALSEETGRALALAPLFWLLGRLRRPAPESSAANGDGDGLWGNPAAGSALGLIAGLGFAAVEGASYGAADMGVALLRAFTAAPLHGACGSRTGMAVMTAKKQPLAALGRFLSAVIIHGMYNFMLLSPGIPPLLAALAAFSALAATLLGIRPEEG